MAFEMQMRIAQFVWNCQEGPRCFSLTTRRIA
jgi:hypothetical protein